MSTVCEVNKRATGVGDEANELPFKNRMANAPSIFLFFDDFSRLYMNLGIRVNPSRKSPSTPFTG